MNLFRRELKTGLKPFLFWALGLFALIFAGIVKSSGATANGAFMTQLLNRFPRIVLAVMGMALWSLATITGGVWLWAGTFYHLQAFPTLEESVYFTLVSFTTLGYGDVLLPKEIRILGGLVAVNGMLNIGILTALLIETIRALRSKQSQQSGQ